LLDLAIRWLAGEPPEVRASDALRPTAAGDQRGEVPTADVMALARELTPRLEARRQASALPRTPTSRAPSASCRRTRGGRAAAGSCVPQGPGARTLPAPEATFDD